MEEQPTIAIIGASGYVGKFLTTQFLEFGLKSGKLAELRVLSTKVKASEDIQSFVDKGAKLYTVDFSNQDSLVKALLESTL